MINDDSCINIFMSLDDFFNNESSEGAGYYEKNNYINKSDSVSMTSSDNERDGGTHISKNIITIYI